jgi:hypothetical protein
MKIQLQLTIFLTLFSALASANQQSILISDIDDTIKVSHVLDTDSVVANASMTRNSFMGMPSLYQALLRDQKADKFVYLSNAPERLMLWLHKRFLQSNGYPDGSLLLSRSLHAKDHKLSSIRNVIKTENPKELILIGDNGEKDTIIYAQIKREYPNLKITTYIHQVYSLAGYRNNFGKPLEIEQSGFATSLDLAAQFQRSGYLSQVTYDEVLRANIPKALAESPYVERGGHMMFPAWLDCRDVQSFDLSDMLDDKEQLVEKFEKKLTQRCSRRPYQN